MLVKNMSTMLVSPGMLASQKKQVVQWLLERAKVA